MWNYLLSCLVTFVAETKCNCTPQIIIRLLKSSSKQIYNTKIRYRIFENDFSDYLRIDTNITRLF